jgi:glutamate synthase (NADPH) small chain
MEKHLLDRRLELMARSGIEMVCNAEVGRAPSWSELREGHDAVIIAVGSRRPRDLEVPGRDLSGVVFAMDYLTRQNRLDAGDADVDPELDAAGRDVIILGGGDTGSDCLGTALRQGARSVLQVELMPRPPDQRPAHNPWPEWPFVYRTSTSQEEGGERKFALLTRQLEGEDGRLRRLRAVEIELADGRLAERPDAEPVVLDVDLLILAMGFVGPESETMAAQLGVDLDPRGNVATGNDHATSVDGVFCAGDANRGQSLIVWAIAEGRQAAAAVEAYLLAR